MLDEEKILEFVGIFHEQEGGSIYSFKTGAAN